MLITLALDSDPLKLYVMFLVTCLCLYHVTSILTLIVGNSCDVVYYLEYYTWSILPGVLISEYYTWSTVLGVDCRFKS